MKRSILIPMVLLMFLCALLLSGCNRPTPSTSGSTPQAALQAQLLQQLHSDADGAE